MVLIFALLGLEITIINYRSQTIRINRPSYIVKFISILDCSLGFGCLLHFITTLWSVLVFFIFLTESKPSRSRLIYLELLKKRLEVDFLLGLNHFAYLFVFLDFRVVAL
jgi:hypothetical protein